MLGLSPRLFVSYSRSDATFVDKLVEALTRRGFAVFRDTSDIPPGENFVSTISGQIGGATGLVAIISDTYSESAWCKAELYLALARGKIAIPVVVSEAALQALDIPLQRLLRDTNYVRASTEVNDPLAFDGFAKLLARARARHRRDVAKRVVPGVLGGALLGAAIWWAVGSLNQIDQTRRRDAAIAEAVNAKRVIQHGRIAQLATTIAGDRVSIGELIFLARDPAISDVGRFNALALESELRKGQKAYRWYPSGLDLERIELTDALLANVSFLGGNWSSATIKDTMFAGSFWSADKRTSLSGSQFVNVQFYGSTFEAITAVDVSFVNSKFRGSSIDTTNFSKVRFATDIPSREGNPIITPNFALFENSVLISHRSPPSPGVLDLTEVGDDIVFDGVVFEDCRLEGWFNPKWFRNSSFTRCVLPESLTAQKLIDVGNTVQ